MKYMPMSMTQLEEIADDAVSERLLANLADQCPDAPANINTGSSTTMDEEAAPSSKFSSGGSERQSCKSFVFLFCKWYAKKKKEGSARFYAL